MLLNVKSVVAVLLALTLVLSTTLCHLYGEYDKLRSEHEVLVTDYSTLSSKYRKLLAEHEQLVSRCEELAKDYEDLQVRFSKLQQDLDFLVHENQALRSKYNELEHKYSLLVSNYVAIESEYESMKANYSVLSASYEHLKYMAVQLNSSLANVTVHLMERCCIPQAFTRVLALDRVKAVGKYVERAGVRADDFWGSVQSVYYWIRRSVRYVQDVPIPVPYSGDCDPETNLCYYSFTELQNYVQDPEFTAIHGQGDCEDQAVLAYAMLEYYVAYVHGKKYAVWIASIELGNGLWHMAVFIPVSGGRLAIVDPAGAYLTSTWYGTITANPASSELARYSNYWQSYGGVRRVELYEVDVSTGSYRLVVSGDVKTIALFILSITS